MSTLAWKMAFEWKPISTHPIRSYAASVPQVSSADACK